MKTTFEIWGFFNFFNSRVLFKKKVDVVIVYASETAFALASVPTMHNKCLPFDCYDLVIQVNK